MSVGKLFYTPTSCGAGAFLVANYAGLDLEMEETDLQTHKTATGTDFYSVNPKGNVPCLILPSGSKLNENIAVLLYLADQARISGRVSNLAPPPDTSESRYLFLNLLSFLATEIHKGFSPLWSADETEKPKL